MIKFILNHDAREAHPATFIGHSFSIDKNNSFHGKCILFNSVQIGSHNEIDNSQILSESSVGSFATVRDSIIGRNTSIGDKSTVLSSIIGDRCSLWHNAYVKFAEIPDNITSIFYARDCGIQQQHRLLKLTFIYQIIGDPLDNGVSYREQFLVHSPLFYVDLSPALVVNIPTEEQIHQVESLTNNEAKSLAKSQWFETRLMALPKKYDVVKEGALESAKKFIEECRRLENNPMDH